MNLLGQPLSFLIYYSLAFYPELFNNEKISSNFYGIDIVLQKRWIKKCQEINENGFEIPTKSNNFDNKVNNSLTKNEEYYNNEYYSFDLLGHIDNIYWF